MFSYIKSFINTNNNNNKNDTEYGSVLLQDASMQYGFRKTTPSGAVNSI